MINVCTFKKWTSGPIIIIFMALQPFFGLWSLLKFFDPTDSRQDSLDGGSASRKASTYTQNDTNAE
jgi:hypothetical protein